MLSCDIIVPWIITNESHFISLSYSFYSIIIRSVLPFDNQSGAGWVRCGTDISYLPGNIPNNSSHQSVTNTNSNNNSNNASGGNGSSNQNSNNNGSNSVANGNYNSTASNSKSEKSKSKSKQNGNNSSSNGHTFFTMTFNYVFEHTSDVCYFAYCHPYTYTDLQNYLYEVSVPTAAAASAQLFVEYCKYFAIAFRLMYRLLFSFGLHYCHTDLPICNT